jgi:hypothetical protein
MVPDNLNSCLKKCSKNISHNASGETDVHRVKGRLEELFKRKSLDSPAPAPAPAAVEASIMIVRQGLLAIYSQYFFYEIL